MKKSLLIAMAVTLCSASFAQKNSSYKTPKMNPAAASTTLKMQRHALSDNATTSPVIKKYKTKPPVPSVMGLDTPIGNTTYDLMTNSSVADRIVYNPNGTVQATWTFSTDLGGSWPDRGTGYNYFDGTNWGAFPTVRIEGSTRTGWPEMISLGNGGEVVISHAPALPGLMKSSRDTIGTGTWNVSDLKILQPSVLWPRAQAGGPDGNTIHLIAHSDPAASIVGFAAGTFFYSRSLDGGVNWDIQSVQIPGFDTSLFALSSADSYAISVRGNTVAVAYFGQLERTVMAKSIDNGNTWTYKEVYKSFIKYDPASANTSGSPIGISDINGDGVADTLTGTDGSGAIIIDNNNVAHLFWGSMRFLDDVAGDNSWSYFPVTNGIGYWNENMGDIPPQIIAGTLQELDLNLSGTVLDDYPTIGIANYSSSLTTMPSAGVDSNGCLYLTYTSIMETLNSGTQFYNHVWATRSCDGGCTWSYPIDMTPNDDFAECIFASQAHKVGAKFHFIYMRDPEPGINLQGDMDPIGVNDIVYVKEDAARLDTIVGACVSGITSSFTTFCSGDSVQLSAFCGTAWQWSGGETTQSIFAKTFGTFICTTTNACGTVMDTIVLSAPTTSPVVTVSASATTACLGDSVTIWTNNVSSATWNWSTGDNTQTIVVTIPGTIICTVTNCGGATIDSITISLPPAPVASITSGTTICAGDSIALSANSGSGLTYMWSTGDSIQSIYVDSIGTYYVVVTNCTGSDTASVTITTTPAPTATITPLGPTTFCQGTQLGLQASGAGTGGTYMWSTGQTGQTITDTLSASITVTAFNACGDSAVSAPVVINVNPLPPVPTVACSGVDTAGYITFVATVSAGTYKWYINGTQQVSGATNDTLVLDWQTALGKPITIKVTDANGCSSTSVALTCGTLGIKENPISSSVKVYPNPNDGQFSLYFNNVVNDNYTMNVMNVLGQTIYNNRITVGGNYKMNIDLSGVDAGVYFLTISNSKEQFTQKVMLK